MKSTAREVPQLRPGVRLGQDPLSGEPLLLYPEGYVLLNSTAHAVIAHCDGKVSIQELIQRLAAEYQVEPEIIRTEVIDCLHELQKLLVIHIRKEEQ